MKDQFGPDICTVIEILVLYPSGLYSEQDREFADLEQKAKTTETITDNLINPNPI